MFMGCILSIMKENAEDRALEIFRKQGGVLQTTRAIELGVHPRTLYALRDDGKIRCISRGLHCLTDHGILNQSDIIAVALRVPRSVMCLVSALAFHDITTHVPDIVHVAVPRRMHIPKLDIPPTRFHRYGEVSYKAGIEKYEIEGVNIRVYCPEKTIVDCFKFRNKIGVQIAIEGLRLYKDKMKPSLEKLRHYGRICRVERIMIPYMESIL